MKTYKFEVIITEGYDEWWEALSNKSGCDEITQILKDELFDSFPDAKIRLLEYTDDKR